MYEDDPQDKVFDVLGGAVFGEHPLGRAIIGRAEVVARHAGRADRGLPRRALRAAQRRRSPPAGSVDHDALVELARGERAAATGAAPPERPTPAAAPRSPRRALRAQGHRAVPRVPRRARASPRDDERRFALRVLDDDLRRHVVLAAVPGGARAARPRLLGVLVLERLRRHRPGRALPRHAADNLAEALRVVGDELARLRRRSGQRRGARALARRTSRAGSCSSLESTVRAHEPPRLLACSAACRCSRIDEVIERDRRRHARRPARAGRRAVRARAAVGGAASAPTRTRSAAALEPRRRRRCGRRHDPRRGRRRRRADGRRRSAPPSRARTTSS